MADSRTENALVETTAPTLPRRLLLPLALLVPLVIDPYGADTLLMERLVMSLVGCALLLIEASEGLFSRRVALPLAGPEAMLLALIAWSATSLLWATNPLLGVMPMILMLALMGIARAIRAAATSEGAVAGWTAFMIIAGLLIIGIDSMAIHRAASDLSADTAKYASLLFEHNNMGANYAVVLLPLAATISLGSSGVRRWLGFAGVVGLLYYLVTLGSRSGVIFAIMALPLICLAFMLRRAIVRMRFTGRVVGVVTGIVVLVLAVLPFSDPARGLAKDAFYAAARVTQQYGVAEIQDSGFRPDIFKNTVSMAQEAPFYGVGVANWSVEYPRYERYILDRPHAHNDALRMLAELGLPGLLLFLGFFGSLITTQWRVLVSARSKSTYACALGLLGATCGYLFCGMFEVPFTMGSTASLLALVMGLTVRMGEKGKAASVEQRPNTWMLLMVAGIAAASIGYVLQRLPATALLEESREFRAAGDLDAASLSLTRIAEMRTGSWIPGLELAQLELERGRHESALVHVRSARSLSPYKTDLMRIEGRALLELERYDEALRSFEQVATLAPGDESAQAEYVEALASAGELIAAIDLMEYKVQSQMRTVNVESLLKLALYWRLVSEQSEDEIRMRALVAARHFYAVVFEEGSPEEAAAVASDFKHTTHLLQTQPGSLDNWWPIYEQFLTSGGWHRPNTALWTSMDADGVKLFPGWQESAGPPLPRELRHLP
ncbi:MAG: O-antigen ligase family protein [Planctomycetota bacterium]|nr:O-antigen ligase family protein [Planctomycetota bacterium]